MKYVVKVGEETYEVQAPTKYDAKIGAIRAHIKKYPDEYHSQSEVMDKLNVEVLSAE
jgi:hypothetical protein